MDLKEHSEKLSEFLRNLALAVGFAAIILSITFPPLSANAGPNQVPKVIKHSAAPAAMCAIDPSAFEGLNNRTIERLTDLSVKNKDELEFQLKGPEGTHVVKLHSPAYARIWDGFAREFDRMYGKDFLLTVLNNLIAMGIGIGVMTLPPLLGPTFLVIQAHPIGWVLDAFLIVGLTLMVRSSWARFQEFAGLVGTHQWEMVGVSLAHFFNDLAFLAIGSGVGWMIAKDLGLKELGEALAEEARRRLYAPRPAPPPMGRVLPFPNRQTSYDPYCVIDGTSALAVELAPETVVASLAEPAKVYVLLRPQAQLVPTVGTTLMDAGAALAMPPRKISRGFAKAAGLVTVKDLRKFHAQADSDHTLVATPSALPPSTFRNSGDAEANAPPPNENGGNPSQRNDEKKKEPERFVATVVGVDAERKLVKVLSGERVIQIPSPLATSVHVGDAVNVTYEEGRQADFWPGIPHQMFRSDPGLVAQIPTTNASGQQGILYVRDGLYRLTLHEPNKPTSNCDELANYFKTADYENFVDALDERREWDKLRYPLAVLLSEAMRVDSLAAELLPLIKSRNFKELKARVEIEVRLSRNTEANETARVRKTLKDYLNSQTFEDICLQLALNPSWSKKDEAMLSALIREAYFRDETWAWKLMEAPTPVDLHKLLFQYHGVSSRGQIQNTETSGAISAPLIRSAIVISTRPSKGTVRIQFEDGDREKIRIKSSLSGKLAPGMTVTVTTRSFFNKSQVAAQEEFPRKDKKTRQITTIVLPVVVNNQLAYQAHRILDLHVLTLPREADKPSSRTNASTATNAPRRPNAVLPLPEKIAEWKKDLTPDEGKVLDEMVARAKDHPPDPLWIEKLAQAENSTGARRAIEEYRLANRVSHHEDRFWNEDEIITRHVLSPLEKATIQQARDRMSQADFKSWVDKLQADPNFRELLPSFLNAVKRDAKWAHLVIGIKNERKELEDVLRVFGASHESLDEDFGPMSQDEAAVLQGMIGFFDSVDQLPAMTEGTLPTHLPVSTNSVAPRNRDRLDPSDPLYKALLERVGMVDRPGAKEYLDLKKSLGPFDQALLKELEQAALSSRRLATRLLHAKTKILLQEVIDEFDRMANAKYPPGTRDYLPPSP